MNRTRSLMFFPCVVVLTATGRPFPVVSKAEIVKGEIGARLDEYLTRITPFGFSGALLVARNGEILVNRGYGMAIREKGVANTAETVLNTGSLTKQFTAAAVMQLSMQGRLRTSDPISMHLEGVPADKTAITLRHLLTHTAGVIDSVGSDYVEAHRDETVRQILAAPLEFKPGERFQYSNAGYTLLAAILEKVSGQSYEDFLDQHLFQTARIAFTGYRKPRWSERVVAHWYVGEQDNGTPLEKPYPYWNVIGNGEILSTTDDMYRWHLALLGEKVLSAEAKNELFTPFLNDYAYGWDSLQTARGLLIQHDGGSALGSSAELRRYIDAKVVTMVFCNQSYRGFVLFQPIRDKIERLAFGGTVEIPPAVRPASPAELKKFEGDYRISPSARLRARVANGALEVTPLDQQAIDLLFFSQPASPSRQDLNQRAEAVIAAALNGDFQPLARDVAAPETLERLRHRIALGMERFRESTGALKGAQAKGTEPFQDDSVATLVELKGERGSAAFRVMWQGGKIAGLRPTRSTEPASTPFLPLSDGELAGYDLDMARNIRLAVSFDRNGAVTAFTLPAHGGSVTARKVP